MRVAAEITLSKEEHRKLERWASARRTSVRLRERARIVLMECEGMTNKAIAAELGTDANKVGRWRSRVAKEGMSSIEKERPRGANHGGKNSDKQAELRSKVLDGHVPAGRVPTQATRVGFVREALAARLLPSPICRRRSTSPGGRPFASLVRACRDRDRRRQPRRRGAATEGRLPLPRIRGRGAVAVRRARNRQPPEPSVPSGKGHGTPRNSSPPT